MLNSFWGKFAQQTKGVARRKLLHNIDEVVELILDDKIEHFETFHVSEEILGVNYIPRSEFEEDVTKTNVYVAAFTTALARLE